jgi:hypothetical protein
LVSRSATGSSIRDAAPNIYGDHHPDERAALRDVRLDESPPTFAGTGRDAREAVTGQIDEPPLRRDLEKVDQLRAPGRLAHARELAHARDEIDRRRFARIGPPDERHLAADVVGEVRGSRGTREEARCLHGVETARRLTPGAGSLVYNRPPFRSENNGNCRA